MPRIPELSRIEVVDEAVAAILRTKTPAERLAMMEDANQFVRKLMAGHLMTRFPSWTKEQIEREIARRLCPEIEETQSQRTVVT